MNARSKRRGGVWLSSFSVTHWPAVGWVGAHVTCARCTQRPVAVGVFFLILKDFIEISNTRYRNEAVVAPMYAL